MWKFDQTENDLAVTDRQILEQMEPIRYAIHYLDDHSWAFISGVSDPYQDGKAIPLGEICLLDPSLEEIAHLKPGYMAQRAAIGEKWTIIEDSHY